MYCPRLVPSIFLLSMKICWARFSSRCGKFDWFVRSDWFRQFEWYDLIDFVDFIWYDMNWSEWFGWFARLIELGDSSDAFDLIDLDSGELNVHYLDDAGFTTKQMTITGDQGDQWLQGQHDMASDKDFRVGLQFYPLDPKPQLYIAPNPRIVFIHCVLSSHSNGDQRPVHTRCVFTAYAAWRSISKYLPCE